MRLSAQQVNSIIHALNIFIQNQSCELRLYGSRIRDEAKGGDIDLLLITDNENFANELLLNKHKILTDIKKEIGDQKIDLKIAPYQEMQADPFLQIILSDSIELKRWKK